MMNLSVIRRTLILSTLFAFAASANEVVVTNPSGLQIAIDQASPGDVILLQPGTVYRGNFKLRSKPAGAPITIRTNGSIPSGRVGPTATLARIVSHNSSPAIEFLPNADNYRIVGVEITVESGIYSYDVVRVGSLAATRIEDQPDNIEFDRVYLHGDSSAGSKRGMMLSTNRVRVRRSYISDFKSKGQDAMAQVEGESCGGCYQNVTTNMINDLLMSRVVFCKTCGRLLYLPEDRSPGKQ